MVRNNGWGWSLRDDITSSEDAASLQSPKGQTKQAPPVSFRHLSISMLGVLCRGSEADTVWCAYLSDIQYEKRTIWCASGIPSLEIQNDYRAECIPVRGGLHPPQAHTHTHMHRLQSILPKFPGNTPIPSHTYLLLGYSLWSQDRGITSFMCVTTEPAPRLASDLCMYFMNVRKNMGVQNWNGAQFTGFRF